MRTPVVLLTGVDPDAMAAALIALQLDLPRAVSVRHHIDVERQVLERETIELEHACVSCALREDVVPTLERLAGDGRWATIVAQLPLSAEARQVCGVLASRTVLARRLHVSAVVAAVAREGLVDDLLGGDLLVERGWHCSHDDLRGIGEVACALVEYADVVTVVGGGADPDPDHPDRDAGLDLVRLLARPDAVVVPGAELLGIEMVTPDPVRGAVHQHRRTHAWADPLRPTGVCAAPSSLVWQLELDSERPFHPGRLLDGLEAIGSGRHRSRGCFWLPTRPGVVLEWDGAGGQLSMGGREPWGRRPRRTRLLLSGVGPAPLHLHEAFEALLLDPAEAGSGRRGWQVVEDGFEPWLGPIREAA